MKEKILKGLMAEAASLGACGLLEEGMGAEDFAGLLRTPQGREFCAVHDWPKAASVRGLGDAAMPGLVIAADMCGEIRGEVVDALLSGPGTRAAVIMRGTAGLHHVVAVDGADVTVLAGGYAVGCVDVSATSRVRVVDTDGTSRVRIFHN